MTAEGWHEDPSGRHEACWNSDGAPTARVRDGGGESTDPPPDSSYPGTLQPVVVEARPVRSADRR